MLPCAKIEGIKALSNTWNRKVNLKPNCVYDSFQSSVKKVKYLSNNRFIFREPISD